MPSYTDSHWPGADIERIQVAWPVSSDAAGTCRLDVLGCGAGAMPSNTNAPTEEPTTGEPAARGSAHDRSGAVPSAVSTAENASCAQPLSSADQSATAPIRARTA